MGILLTRALLLSIVLAAAVRAQNSDFALLAGISTPKGEVQSGPNGHVSGSAGVSGQLNYAWQARRGTVADLYIELPLVFTHHDSGFVSMATPSVRSSQSLSNVFFTPGVRVKISPQARVLFYGALGGGLASIGTAEALVSGSNIIANNSRRTTPALGFGGGLDFRLTRLLSIRAEGRDFVAGRGTRDTSGRNHGIFQLGIAFHF